MPISKARRQLNRYRNATFILTALSGLLLASSVTLSLTYAATEIEGYESSEPYAPSFVISDATNESWDQDQELDIFYNEEFGSNTIIPGSKGVYSFKLNNESPNQMTYSIRLDEVNEYDIALKYRLDRDGLAVTSEYVRTSEFKADSLTIESYSSQTFSLQWWWDESVSDTNDTLAGLNNAIYTLSISLSGYISIYGDIEEE